MRGYRYVSLTFEAECWWFCVLNIDLLRIVLFKFVYLHNIMVAVVLLELSVQSSGFSDDSCKNGNWFIITKFEL